MNKTGKIKSLLKVIIIIIAIVAIIGFFENGSTESKVKEAQIQDISIGDALDSYCDETSWDEFTKEEKNASVTKELSGVRFTGKEKYGKGNNVVIDFVIDKDEVWFDGMWENQGETGSEKSERGESCFFSEMANFVTQALKKCAEEEDKPLNEKDSVNKVLDMVYYTDFERKLPEQKIYGIKVYDFMSGINEGQLNATYCDSSVVYGVNSSVKGLADKADKTGIFSSFVDIYDSIGAFNGTDTKLNICFSDSNYFEKTDDSFFKITSVIKEKGEETEELSKKEAVEELRSLLVLYCIANEIKYDENEIVNELEMCVDIESDDSSDATENQQETEEPEVSYDYGEKEDYETEDDSEESEISSEPEEETEIDDESEEESSDEELENKEDTDDVEEEEEYILPKSDSAYLTKTDIKDFDKEELRFAKNELYARHGYIFKSKELNDYFEQFSWYKKKCKPSEWNKAGGDSTFFNKFEIANRDFLVKEIEK